MSTSTFDYIVDRWAHLERTAASQPALIQEGSDVKLPFVLVGDHAFSLTDKVLRPYKAHFLSDTKKKNSTIDCVGHEDLLSVHLAFSATNGEYFIGP
jgi:hypothetical protein